MDIQGQCNLIHTKIFIVKRIKNFYCKTYKKCIYTIYNIKIYKLYLYMTSLLSFNYIFLNVYKNYETQIIKIQKIYKYT